MMTPSISWCVTAYAAIPVLPASHGHQPRPLGVIRARSLSRTLLCSSSGFPNPTLIAGLDLLVAGHRTVGAHIDPQMTSTAQFLRICCTGISSPPIDPCVCVMVWSSLVALDQPPHRFELLRQRQQGRLPPCQRLGLRALPAEVGSSPRVCPSPGCGLVDLSTIPTRRLAGAGTTPASCGTPSNDYPGCAPALIRRLRHGSTRK